MESNENPPAGMTATIPSGHMKQAMMNNIPAAGS